MADAPLQGLTPMDNSRVKGVIVVKPIAYGNISQYFGKKRESDGHTHYWTVYVKPADEHEDMSAYVKKVHFKLHESYPNPQRVPGSLCDPVRVIIRKYPMNYLGEGSMFTMCTKPPYEVSETGWGEFEITIKIYFVDHTERPVTLYHLLKLFQTTDPLFQQQQMSGGQRKHLVSELYDEIIFQDPTQLMYRHLNLKRLQIPPLKPELDWKEKESATLTKIEHARKRVSDEIAQVNERLKKQKHGIQTLKEEIQKLETKTNKAGPTTAT